MGHPGSVNPQQPFPSNIHKELLHNNRLNQIRLNQNIEADNKTKKQMTSKQTRNTSKDFRFELNFFPTLAFHSQDNSDTNCM
jgi:hypothetical protein